MIWCIDLDGTISVYPKQFIALMGALRAKGDKVIVLTGHDAPSTTTDIVNAKIAQLKQLGFREFDTLAVVCHPGGDVADLKVKYMRHVGATALIDNKKQNIKAAEKVGFMTLRVR